MNQKIKELSYYRLYLENFLIENHPDKAKDESFMETRADSAAHVYEEARRRGNRPDEAQELAMATLLEGLHFSKYGMMIEVLSNEFSNVIPQSEVSTAAHILLPCMEGIFAHYPLSDDFPNSPEYKQLYTELTGAILISFEKNGL